MSKVTPLTFFLGIGQSMPRIVWYWDMPCIEWYWGSNLLNEKVLSDNHDNSKYHGFLLVKAVKKVEVLAVISKGP